VSPLRDLISSHVAPERLYLEARWSSLVPYAAAAGLLADVLPIASGANRTTVREHALLVAERAEAELGEERPCFIDGYPAEWEALPIPEGRIVAALDGGYVRNWDDRKNNFELIVGRSVPEDRAPLSRPGPRLRSEAQAPAVRGAEEPRAAGQPGRDLPDRRRRGGYPSGEGRGSVG